SLLNRAIPIIAIQVSAFRLGDRVVLHFAKLLDLAVDSTADDEEPGAIDEVDRAYWVRKASADSMGAADKLSVLIPGGIPVYNKNHIAVGTTGRHFCWIHPRSKSGHVVVDVLVGEADREQWLARLEEAGISARPHRRDTHIKLPHLVQKEIGDQGAVLRELM